MLRRLALLLAASFTILVILTLPASADPDPPVVDGGNVTFIGDWTIDPGDHLVYVNQTITVKGNVTVSPSGTLELVNSTLYLNGTPSTEEWRAGLRVGSLGTLNMTRGSTVRSLSVDYFRVDTDGHLLVEDSTIGAIGHTAYLEMSGLYSEADDTVIRRSTIDMGNHGLILNGVTGCTLEDLVFDGPQRYGLYLLGGTTGITARNLTFVDQMEALRIVDCTGLQLENLSIDGAGHGIGLDGSVVTLRNANVSDVPGESVKYWGWGSLQWVVDDDTALINSTLTLNGTLEVMSGGAFNMVNSSLLIDNPSAHGVNGIQVRSDGVMRVLSGSTVSHVPTGFKYEWLVHTGGALETDAAEVRGAGWNPSSPGLIIMSSDNTVNGTLFSECYTGLTVQGDSNTVSRSTFDACQVGISMTGSNGTLSDLVFQNGTTQGILVSGASNTTVQGARLMGSTARFTNVDGLTLDSCQFRGSTAVVISNVTDATLDLCHFYVPLEVTGNRDLVVRGIIFQTDATSLVVVGVTNVSVIGSSLTNATEGFYFVDCINTTVEDTQLVNVVGAALSLVDSTGALVYNVTVISADVGMNVSGGDGCTLRDIELLNVRVGVQVTGAGRGHALENSTLVSLPVAVSVSSGCQLTIRRSSFYDCPLAIDGDPQGEVAYETDIVSDIMNSTCSLNGRLSVMASGELNITASTMAFLGDDATSSGVEARLGSVLRITEGSILEGRGGTFGVIANGTLVVRKSSFIRGGEPGGPAAMACNGGAAVLVNSTFRDCGLALSLGGSDPTVRGCVFTGNRQSVLLEAVLRLRIIGCSFSLSNTSWDIHGNFTSNLQITECTFEGGGSVPMAMFIQSPFGSNSVLTLRNVTIANYTVWGLQDDHYGNIQMTGCTITSASVRLGRWAGDAATVSDVNVSGCRFEIGGSGFTVSDCHFTNATFAAQANAGGSLLSGCAFEGSLGPATASIELVSSIRVTLRDVDLRDVGVGMSVSGGSDVTVSRMLLDGASGTCLMVNGSIVRFESCRFTDLMGTGVKACNSGSRVEFRNGTISASPSRTGHDVDACTGGDVWLLNTTFNRTSVLSTGAGRVEVLWHVTVEPVLPWGDTLWDPDYLAVADATGAEVVNLTTAIVVMRLFEFSEVDGYRTALSPHTFNVSDHVEGVWYSGAHVVNASVHLVLDLLDVAPPVARAGPDQVVDEDQKVTLDATGSSDNDPNFLEGGAFGWAFDEHGSEVRLEGDVVSYVFSVPGKYWINLTVWDLAGNVARDTVIIQVRDRTPPVIRFSGNLTGDEEEWLIFDASATTDNDPSFDFTTGTFLWRIDLDVGVLERELATFGHAFPNPGNYTGTLSVWDKAGNLAQETFWVAIEDITAPVIQGVSDATVFEPTDGLLDASACFDNVLITSYHWSVTFHNWSGGLDTHYQLQGPTPSFVFDMLGSYTVTLTLSDAAGNVNATDLTVVFDDPPVISATSWVVSMAGVRMEVPVLVSDVYYTDLSVTVLDGPDGPFMEGTLPDVRMVWTPTDVDAGEDVMITVQVHDGFVSSETTITVHVNPGRGVGNSVPVILSDPPLASKRATPYIYTVEAEDPDGDVLGYLLLEGPDGMSISPGGTLSWDPPFDQGTELVDVRLSVTDGRDEVEQGWTIRWREPPNSAPLITFLLNPEEVRVLEEFLVDLTLYVQDPEAYEVDSDDPNYRLTWDVSFDETMVDLVSREGLVFRFLARDIKGATQINFTATDPSGASDTTTMDLLVKGREKPPVEEETNWLLWAGLAVVLVLVMAGGAVASRRRRRYSGPEEREEPQEPGLDLGPVPEQVPEKAATLEAALAPREEAEMSSFVELAGATPGAGPAASVRARTAEEPATRVVGIEDEGPGRSFSVEGVAILEANGNVLASTGVVEDIIGPYADSLEEVRKGLRGDGLAVLEMDGHRVLMALRSGLGAICVIRGKEDDAFRTGLRDQLSGLLQDRSTEGALGVLDDVLASAGGVGRAEVVHDAWTARLDTKHTYQGSVVLLEIRLRNDTDHILNNVRLRLHRDTDALSIQSITPKLLSSHGKMLLGNVPPRKEHKVLISLVPEVCMSSALRVLATYTDMEGRTVHVPSPSMPVDVECPYIEPGVEMDEDALLSLSEAGLGFTGRRVFTHGLDVDHQELYDIAVRLVDEQGPMKVLDLDDTSLMRAEAWFLGSGEGGTPRVLVRVSSHGADHMLDVFATSEDGATVTGLLTHLATEILDRAASKMPGKRVEKVKDSATLEEVAVWPSLLDYKIMGD